jgi:hypothetical protein
MDVAKQDELDRAFAEWRELYLTELWLVVYQYYLSAELDAFDNVGEDIDEYVYKEMQREAEGYANEYKQILDSTGGSIINGEQVPWLQNMEQMYREEVTTIINEGIRDGLPTGDKELPGGGYEPGTIADRLEVYFDGEKSQASKVARTEVARIENVATLRQYKKLNGSYVKVSDNEGPNSCELCAEANGKVWSVAYAELHTLQHPHCVRRFDLSTGDETHGPEEGA